MKTNRAALVSLVGIGVFVALVLLLHFIKPELAPSWRFISEYSIGRLGWVMMLAFFCWSLSCVALVVALRGELATRSVRIGRVALLAVGVSLAAAGLFAQDPVTATPDQLTTHGTLHAVASLIGIPGIPVAALLVGVGLTRHNPEWSRRKRLVMGTAHLTWISLIAMVVYLVVMVPEAGGFGPRVQAGWLNRLVVLTYCLWQVTVGYGALMMSRRAVT